jgi:hypothetical protein
MRIIAVCLDDIIPTSNIQDGGDEFLGMIHSQNARKTCCTYYISVVVLTLPVGLHSAAAIRKAARRLYVGNLPVGTIGIEAMLTDLFNM